MVEAVVKSEMFQLATDWLNAEALVNIVDMFVTFEVSKFNGLLNTEQLLNIAPMFVTFEVLNVNVWLNAAQPLNMPFIDVTFPVSKSKG